MDDATLHLHRAVLRQLKGILTAYNDWISDKEAERETALLRIEREIFDKTMRTK